MTNIGKPYEGELHVRFDEEGLNFLQPFTLEHESVSGEGQGIVRYDKLAFIGAMDEEIDSFHSLMENGREVVHAGITFRQGYFFGKEVVVCRSGVGKVNAAVCTQLLVDRFGIDAIIFTGVAGALDPELAIGDIVISDECMQHDMDATALGYAKGTIPYQSVSIFPADVHLADMAYKISRKWFGDRVKRGRVLSGDQFIADREMVRVLHAEMRGMCAEMEGAAVAQVCHMNSIPYVVIRSMSDKADGSAHVDFPEFCRAAADNASRIVTDLVKEML